MVAGAFGGVYGREHLCVQSMDGFVTLVEQDRLVGMRQLSKFLLPGPLAYCTKAEAAGGEKCPQASCPIWCFQGCRPLLLSQESASAARKRDAAS